MADKIATVCHLCGNKPVEGKNLCKPCQIAVNKCMTGRTR